MAAFLPQTKRVVWLMIGFVGALLVLYIWGMVTGGDFTRRWPVYVGWVLHWGVNIVLGFALFMYIKTLLLARQTFTS